MTPRFMRVTSALVLVTFVTLILEPASVWAQDPPQGVPPASASPAPPGTPRPLGLQGSDEEEQLSRALGDVHELLKELAPASAMPEAWRVRQAVEKHLVATRRAESSRTARETKESASRSSRNLDAKLTVLRTKLRAADAALSAIQKSFGIVEKELVERELPAELLERHREAIGELESRRAEFERLAAEIERAEGERLRGALANLGTFMATYPSERPGALTDPLRLPWRGADPSRTRKPLENDWEFTSAINPTGMIRLARAGDPAGFLPTVAVLAATPGPEDVAATEDAQITPAIRELATSLGNDPRTIFNWVHSNIQFVPTYGSVQGSQLTLANRRGNAFDTSSLLVALLRAADTPARYVFGTIELPAEAVTNWVGGVASPEEALSLLGQGGIPSVGVVAAGRFRAVRLEHAWVEAWVDFIPSRGAVHRAGDTWIPMDASFKRHRFTPALDLKAEVPFDAAGLLNEIRGSSIVDEQQGFAQSLDDTVVLQAFRDHQAQIQSYLDRSKPDASIVDLLGAREIVTDDASLLPGTLPYRIIAGAVGLASIPDGLRHKLTLSLYGSELERAAASAQLTYTVSLPALGARRLGVTFQAATAADEQVIAGALAQGATSLPAYLIRVVPHVQVDGVTQVEGSPAMLGVSQSWVATLSGPDNQTSEAPFRTAAGDEMVFAIDGNGLNGDVVVERLAGSRGESAADNLWLAASTYWVAHDWFDELASKAQGATTFRLPSIALASAPFTPRLFFGIPRSGSYLGRQLDARLVVTAATAPTEAARRAFFIQAGLQGAQWEASAFNSVLGRPQGISVSAPEFLAYAHLQGIPIQSITLENLGAAVPTLQVSAAVKADVENAVAAGRVAFLPQREPVVPGGRGTGYILLDPQTGEGAYLVEGGLNGVLQAACGPGVKPPSDPGVDPRVALLVAGYSSAQSVGPSLATSLPNSARAAVPALLPLIGISLAGGGLVLTVGVVLLATALAVAASIALLLAMRQLQLALIEAGIESGDATRTRTKEQDCRCKPAPKPPECECKFRRANHRGGHDVHNACADRFNPPDEVGLDLCVTSPVGAEVCFDAGSEQDKVVWEVKVNRFSTYNASLQGLAVGKNTRQAVRQWANAVASGCGLTVLWAVADGKHADALVNHPGFVGADGLVRAVVHVPQCLTTPDELLPEEDRPTPFNPFR